MKGNKILTWIVLILIIIELLLCIYIIYKESLPNKTCSLGESCSQVQESIYGKVLGIKWQYIGLACFIILLVFFLTSAKLFKIGAIIGFVISLYLVFIQLFVLKEICINCMEIHSVMFIIFILALFVKKKSK